MKRISSIAIFFFIISNASAQAGKDVFYLWDKDWKPVGDIKLGEFFTRVSPDADTGWIHLTYRISAPMLSFETFRDKEGKIPHGEHRLFFPNGFIDSTGKFFNGFEEGEWAYYTNKGVHIYTKRFEKGTIVEVRDILKEKKAAKDTVIHSGVEIESDFKGGIKGWSKYLNENLNYPLPAQNAIIQGTVVVQFKVTSTGEVKGVSIVQSVEYSIDEESLRLIVNSPKWIPASQDGRKVTSYKKQPITFRLQ